jgi:regulator of sigma E protease
MSEFFGSVWWLIVTLGVLITFHEFGHFVVARRCGVKVLKFSVGFGKALWSRFDSKGTQFVIAAIPLGGYVKMLDEREVEGAVGPKGLEGAHNRASVGARMAIAAAGPAFNLVFAVAAFWLMLVVGKPDYPPVVGETTGLAAAAGFASGDRITDVNGEPVTAWTDAFERIMRQALDARPTDVTVRTAHGADAVRRLPLDRLTDPGNIEHDIDEIGLKLKPPVPAVVAAVSPGMPAAKAGLEKDDRIVAINSTPIADFAALGETIQKEAAKSPNLAFTIERSGQRLDRSVEVVRQGEGDAQRWIVGIEAPNARVAQLRYGPLAAVPAALKETWRQAKDMLGLLGSIVTGHASAKNIGGIISIGQAANASAEMGFAWFINFLGAVSLTLAVMNLLPIPILDGGHLLYYLIEFVKGSPVSERTQVAGQYVGLMLLVALMGLAFYNDILRIAS